jgi:hypothetical protein
MHRSRRPGWFPMASHHRRPGDACRSARATTMDRSSVWGLVVAGGSVLVSAARAGSVELTVRHACSLILPLAVIAFPEVSEVTFRRSWRGLAHGGEAPAPAAVIRLAAWGLLIVLVLVHHCWGFPGVR